MKNLRTVVWAGLLVLAAACSSTPSEIPTWNTMGGSRADGTVRLGYEKTTHLTASSEQGLALARKRCAAWGYERAESFDYDQTKCLAYGKKRCRRWLVEREYQCTCPSDDAQNKGSNHSAPINININNNGSPQPGKDSGRPLKPL